MSIGRAQSRAKRVNVKTGATKCHILKSGPYRYYAALKIPHSAALETFMKRRPILSPLSLPIILSCTASMVVASDHIEEVIISDVQRDQNPLSGDIANSAAADSAALLRTIPGANLNKLGAITGIAQYRGVYGDRLSIELDGSPMFSGGPNAMDTPLSYAPSLLLKHLNVSRGIASVGSAQESLGGHMAAELDRGEFGSGADFGLGGKLANRYQSVNNGTSSALRGLVSNQNHKVALLASYDTGNNADFDGGELTGTQYRRTRYDLSYGYHSDATSLLAYIGRNDTGGTGTPALAMDINLIDTDLAGLNFSTEINEITVKAFVAYSDVSHSMDNFRQRIPPMMAMNYRHIQADARHLSFGLNGELPLSSGALKVGVDATRKDQDATITNPANAMFSVANFNGVRRDINGLFAEWRADISDWQMETGVRYNQATLDAATVSASGMMGMNVGTLATTFNNSNRHRTFNYADLVLKTSRSLDSSTTLELGLARKHRAPSYQEMYLWLPLPTTGGLGDGRSYIGNLDLREESAVELTAGINWNSNTVYFTPQLFYRDVSNYIQGTPASTMVANMVSTMMSGAPALQFNNIDAELYGLDSGYGIRVNSNWRLDGVLSYVRGQRKDNGDHLYRLAPLNHRLTVTYQKNALQVQAESVLYATQNRVASFNNEQATSGYGIVNLRALYNLNERTTVSAGIENLLDKGYQDHLAGYNRIAGSDVAIGERLFGYGRNLTVAISLSL